MDETPFVWIKPTGATGGSSTRNEIVSPAMLKRFYNDTLGASLDQVVNDFPISSTPVNPEQSLLYHCKTSMCMFTTLPQ